MKKQENQPQIDKSEMNAAEAERAFSALRFQASAVPEMSLDEINAEIAAVRAEREDCR